MIRAVLNPCTRIKLDRFELDSPWMRIEAVSLKISMLWLTFPCSWVWKVSLNCCFYSCKQHAIHLKCFLLNRSLRTFMLDLWKFLGESQTKLTEIAIERWFSIFTLNSQLCYVFPHVPEQLHMEQKQSFGDNLLASRKCKEVGHSLSTRALWISTVYLVKEILPPLISHVTTTRKDTHAKMYLIMLSY